MDQMWTEVPKGKNKKPVNKDRFISKLFLRYVVAVFKALAFANRLLLSCRGDSVILSAYFVLADVSLINIWTVLRNQA